MALDKGDKKWIADNTATVVLDVIEKVVIPQFAALEEKMTKKLSEKIDGVEKKLTKKIEDVDKKLSGKIDGVELRLGRRIDNLAAVVTEVKTKHERRIEKLEEKAGFLPA